MTHYRIAVPYHPRRPTPYHPAEPGQVARWGEFEFACVAAVWAYVNLGEYDHEVQAYETEAVA